jgi:signal transduction histidine kinase
MGEVDHDEMMEYMQIIRKSSQQLLEKIKSIILISTLDSDDIPVILELVSIKRIFNEIEAFYKAAEEEGGQTVLNRLVFIVPNENDIYAKTDFEKVKLVLQQLIDNALKFSHQGTVEVGCKQTGKNQLEFYVSDTGIGIPEDKKDFVFDLFRMVDESPRRQYGGSGLGLYIVKRLLTLMNTPINLKSKVGVGTRVSFILNPNT